LFNGQAVPPAVGELLPVRVLFMALGVVCIGGYPRVVALSLMSILAAWSKTSGNMAKGLQCSNKKVVESGWAYIKSGATA
jgi:hypothetical protein